MSGKRALSTLLIIIFLLVTGVTAVRTTHACGGLFCLNTPIDQNAERIIFTQNGDGTISALIQIQYTGFDIDFSWILPLPDAISVEEDIQAPETAATAFTEIELATNPVFIPPPLPDCAQVEMMALQSDVVEESGVEIFDEGNVGPYNIVIVGSDDPQALVNWLLDNGYRVEEAMFPLIDVYVEEQFVFLAMRLQPDFGVQDIQPLMVTYPSQTPMIPLRLTAVAANPDMAVLTWFFADQQAVPDNYGHFEIEDEEITFFTFGGNNYRSLMGQKANEMNGQAFITEYAAPTSEISFSDPLLQEFAQKHSYLTRLNTVISPEEMTVDPVFTYDNRDNVFNVHDLSDMRGLYDCEREQAGNGFFATLFGTSSSGPSSNDDDDDGPPSTNQNDNFERLGAVEILLVLLLVIILIAAGIFIGSRARRST